MQEWKIASFISKNVYEYSYVVDVCMLICCYPICYKYLL